MAFRHTALAAALALTPLSAFAADAALVAAARRRIATPPISPATSIATRWRAWNSGA